MRKKKKLWSTFNHVAFVHADLFTLPNATNNSHAHAALLIIFECQSSNSTTVGIRPRGHNGPRVPYLASPGLAFFLFCLLSISCQMVVINGDKGNGVIVHEYMNVRIVGAYIRSQGDWFVANDSNPLSRGEGQCHSRTPPSALMRSLSRASSGVDLFCVSDLVARGIAWHVSQPSRGPCASAPGQPMSS